MSSSSSSTVPSSSIGEVDENSCLTGMNLGFHKLEERIIATTTCTNTQLLPSIIDTIGCDITIKDMQSAKQELLNDGVDLTMHVNKNQKLPNHIEAVTPLFYFCRSGNLLIVRLLLLIGASADCTHCCYWFPMLAAAARGHLDICKLLFKFGGDAKYQINKETLWGDTPLWKSYLAWRHGNDKEGNTCLWLLLNGGGQHLSAQAVRMFTNTNSNRVNILVLWMRENIQLHETFILFLCGATTMVATSTSLEPSDGGTCNKRQRKTNHEQSLQILAGHPGIMEIIGDYVGVIRGKEFRMLKEYNKLVIEYTNTDESSDDDVNDNDEDEGEE